MSRSGEDPGAMGSTASQGLEERYLEFNAKSAPAFVRYPQVEPLRLFIFKELLVQRRADRPQDSVKHWLRPLLRRARTRLVGCRSDVLIWLENEREVMVDALLPIRRALAARDIGVDLVSCGKLRNLPVARRVFRFPARAVRPEWARGAWEALSACEEGLRDRALGRSFYHACAMLQGLYDELHTLLDAARPKVVLSASTRAIGGAALTMASQLHGITSLVLQHGMQGAVYAPVLADLMLTWGASSDEILLSAGVPRASLLAVGSPRHDAMKPSGNGVARSALLRALALPELPTFVFFSQGNDPVATGEAAAESARWLEETAAQYANALNVVVRLHPNEDGALYRHRPHLTVMSRAVELAIALEGCDWFGSIFSTVLYDGLLYGKQAWQFHADHWPVRAFNWRQGLARRVASQRQFSEMVRHVLSQGSPCEVDEALVARVFANRGRATEAVVDVVASCLNLPAASLEAHAAATTNGSGE